MTVDEMYTLLDTRLEDAGRTKFVVATRLLALTNAETKLVPLVDNKYLTELETSDLNKSISSGYYLLSSLTGDVVTGKKGITRVKVHGGKWMTPMEPDELQDQQNTLYAPSVLNPKYYVYESRLYVVPTTIPKIDIYYLKNPALNGTQTILNVELHDIMVTLAEAELWGTSRDFDRQKAALESAIASIAVLNEKAKQGV